jgi:plastocyanin
MAKQIINIGASANDGTGDPLRNAFDKANDNFTELYFALGSSTNAEVLFDQNGAFDLVGKPHKISFLHDTEESLLALSPSTYHGSIGHAHDTGALYYAHGEWRKVLTDTSAGAVTNYSDPLNNIVYSTNITNSETVDYVLKSNADGTYTWVAQSGGGGSSTIIGLSDTPSSFGTAGQALVVNSNADGLVFDDISGGGGSYADSDVDAHINVSGASENDILSWNGTDYSWISQSGGGAYNDNAVSAHLNVSSASANQVLQWDGSDFAWAALSGGGGSTAMADITDTTITNPQSDDILKYFGSDGTWRNVTFTPTYLNISEQPAGVSDKALFENSFLNATTVLKVTNNGSSSYRFDQYGTADNPTIYVKAGTTVGFDLTGAGGAVHPFVIQTAAGADYNEGLVALDLGVYYEGSAANAGIGGALFWKIPAGISGNYRYICQAHSSMVGTIVIEPAAGNSGGGGGGSLSRATESEQATSLNAGSSTNLSFANLGISYALYTCQVDAPCWVRIYSDTASRTADASRTQGEDPPEGGGVIAEFIATQSGTTEFKVTPAIYGYVDDSETTVPVTVTNIDSGTATITVSLTGLVLES